MKPNASRIFFLQERRFLSPGKTLAVRGEGLALTLGTVIEAREIGASTDDLHPIRPKKPKHEKRRDHEAGSHVA
jgi:hypothetical protein